MQQWDKDQERSGRTKRGAAGQRPRVAAGQRQERRDKERGGGTKRGTTVGQREGQR
jgi:hypothetical protein